MTEHKRCEKCNSYLRHNAACFPCAWRAWAERNNIKADIVDECESIERAADEDKSEPAGMVYGACTIKL